MTSFEKLVDQVDDAIFNTVSEYLEEVMGGAGNDFTNITQERVLVHLLRKHRPENVIFVEEEEVDTPEQVIYGVYDTLGTWLTDVSGLTEGELFDDLCDAMDVDDEDDLLMEGYFTIGQPTIKFQCRRAYFTLKKR